MRIISPSGSVVKKGKLLRLKPWKLGYAVAKDMVLEKIRLENLASQALLSLFETAEEPEVVTDKSEESLDEYRDLLSIDFG